MRRYWLIFIVFANLLPFQLKALNRDYSFSYYCRHCTEHIPIPQLKYSKLTSELSLLIPHGNKQCVTKYYYDEDDDDYYEGPQRSYTCPNFAIYEGYIDYAFLRYSFHLKRHLEYCQKNPSCHCYWPEYSQEAAEISDTAYLLFRDLILTTKLSMLLDDSKQQIAFNTDILDLNLHGLTIAFIAKQLHFYDYYNVCQDIENYSLAHYEARDAAKIKDKLDDILEVLYHKFFKIYQSCLQKHPSDFVNQEVRFMKFLVNDTSALKEIVPSPQLASNIEPDQYNENFLVRDFPTLNMSIEPTNRSISNKNTNLKFSLASRDDTAFFFPESNSLTEQGTLMNNLLLHKEAISILTLSIQLNPLDQNAYIERAMAYFETNQLSLALKDYEQAKKLIAERRLKAFYIPESKSEFSKGLVLGVLSGAGASTLDFFPSIFSSCRGILNGLWAFTCSPIEVSNEMINTAYAIGEFISTHSKEECFQYIVPELKELSESWDKLNDYSRGQKIGYIIGKYGVDIFIPATLVKGINKVKAVTKLKSLKRANTMATLEACAASPAKQAKILEESTKHASMRIKLLESAPKGKIFIKNSNVQNHVMQKKHAWEKVISISGNVEEDFRKVALLLEENAVLLSPQYLKETMLVADGILRKEYEIIISNYTVKAVFSDYFTRNEIFLSDAWVITVTP